MFHIVCRSKLCTEINKNVNTLMTFTVPELKYKYDSLSPYIDTETMKEHHDFHHSTYVNSLNSVIKTIDYQDEGLTNLLAETAHSRSIGEDERTGIRNHAGGHYNHSLFWLFMNRKSRTQDISDSLMEMIIRDFSSLESLKSEFNLNAVKVFGSGWAWLVYQKKEKKLKIVTTANQDTPFYHDKNNIPFLGLDVWEHAYYLQYKHARKDYVARWWNVVDWENVSHFFENYALKERLIHVNADGTVE